MALGDHLRADQHVDLPGRHPVDQTMMSSLALGRVTVHACQPGAGEELPEFLLEAFRAHPLREEPGTAAAITAVRRGLTEVTVMAAQGTLHL